MNTTLYIFLLGSAVILAVLADSEANFDAQNMQNHPKNLQWRAAEGSRVKRWGGWGGGYPGGFGGGYPGGYGGGYPGGYGGGYGGGYPGYGGSYGSSSWGSYSSSRSGGFSSFNNGYWGK